MESRELQGWSIRAVALGWPSGAIVIMMGAWRGATLLAMAAGIATYALGFAYLASRPVVAGQQQRLALWKTLETAAMVKALWLLAGVFAWGLAIAANLKSPFYLSPFFAALFLDTLTGGLALSIASGLDHATGFVSGPRASFLPTLVVTLLQGAFIALSLLPLMLVVQLWQRHQTTRYLRGPFR